MPPTPVPPTSVASVPHDQVAPEPTHARAPAQAQPGPPRDLLFRRRLRPSAMLRELSAPRELVLALTERDFRARYKQTKVGFAWAVITPLLLMVAFTLFFKHGGRLRHRRRPLPAVLVRRAGARGRSSRTRCRRGR